MSNLVNLKSFGIFVLSYLITIILCVYVFNLPQQITGNYSLVNEYYYDNWKTSMIMDFIFIILYGLFAYGIWSGLRINNIYYKGIVLVLSTALLTVFFWWYYTRNPLDEKSFFSRWFHTVGWSAAIYDMILLGALFVVYQSLISVL